MAADLQSIVDALAERLQRSVAIDDKRGSLQAHSPHHGPVDDARIRSLLERQAPPEMLRWGRSLGIDSAIHPVRLPGRKDWDLLPRICAPIWNQDILFGFLWIIDPEETLSDVAVDDVAKAAEEIGVVLYREHLLNELERGRERELIRDLLSESSEVRSQASRSLIESGVLSGSESMVLMVVRLVAVDDRVVDETLLAALEHALEQMRRHFSPRHALVLTRYDHGLLLFDSRDRSGPQRGSGETAAQLRKAVTRAIGDSEDFLVAVGISASFDDLTCTEEAYKQAQLAARVAMIDSSAGAIADWTLLGVYRLLVQFPPEALTPKTLHPGLVHLFKEDTTSDLVRTLETYLDLAGNVKAASEVLVLHRTSLYHRLNRIQEIADADLGDGEQRLALHLGLKLARLAGFHPSPL